ncbi:MAG TPA: RDD family protein, partial [Gemmatimonadaceae bacterium]
FDDVLAEGGGASNNPVAELPLFGPPITDDVPLITKPSPPRPPLSVRRATPEVPRVKAEARAPLLDWPDPGPVPSHTPRVEDQSVLRAPSERPEPRISGSRRPEAEPASLAPRALAAAIDVVLLGLVDLIVVYLTMKICRLNVSELALLPKAPLLTFLLLQNGGYMVAFTTTGQTLGKMIAGVRVLADDSEHAPDLGRSVLRASVWMLLAVPAGLGLLSATLSRDGRGLHDRFAGTRVVRAGA